MRMSYASIPIPVEFPTATQYVNCQQDAHKKLYSMYQQLSNQTP